MLGASGYAHFSLLVFLSPTAHRVTADKYEYHQ
jgi:hypothetical protein